MRPPHWRWGAYYWSPRWGWYFTTAVIGSTLVFRDTLPPECQRIDSGDETLFLCDGTLYRATEHQQELVYEIVSPDASEGEMVEGVDAGVLGLQLTQPMTRGPSVRLLQRTLRDAGESVGAIDGIFGSATETGLMWYQYNNGLEPSGFVDDATARALGFLPPLPEVEAAPTDSDPAAEAVEAEVDPLPGASDVTSGSDEGGDAQPVNE
ncbi:peptidoglycan-binding protein [Ruegeria pomeroyi]|nr:peptidoglycan-binding protein [Ruegeria pomeroyi]MCE8534645.1 peptidoglycan-binding protein [Ruegeria pomeroyi]